MQNRRGGKTTHNFGGQQAKWNPPKPTPVYKSAGRMARTHTHSHTHTMYVHIVVDENGLVSLVGIWACGGDHSRRLAHHKSLQNARGSQHSARRHLDHTLWLWSTIITFLFAFFFAFVVGGVYFSFYFFGIVYFSFFFFWDRVLLFCRFVTSFTLRL